MKVFFLIFFSVFLNHCFIIPRFQIKRALSFKDCKSLSQNLLYDLQKKDLQKAVSVCLVHKKYKKALVLAWELEKKELTKKEKTNLWEQKLEVYSEHLLDFKSSIVELKKLLKLDPNIRYTKMLIQAYLKSNQLQKALDVTDKTLPSTPSEEIEIQFIKARLLMLSRRRVSALKIFNEIKKKDFNFFKKNEGPFYTALLLEETQKFDEAIQELEQADWVFAGEKKNHWIYRKENAP